MKRILHSNLVNHTLGTKPVGRAVVVHASRPIFATCSPDDLEFLQRNRPLPEDNDQDGQQAIRSAADRGGDYGGGPKITKYIRAFLIRATGLQPWATDDEAKQHFDSLHPDLQEACRAHAASEEADEEDDDQDVDVDRAAAAGAGDAARGIYVASAPGRADAAQEDVSAAGALARQFRHAHVAHMTMVPPQYDQLSGPEDTERGIRILWGTCPATLEKQPIEISFDADLYSEDEARAWLASRNYTGYDFEPNASDQPTETHGPREEPQKPPADFDDLPTFLAATIETDEPGEGSGQPSRVRSYAALPGWVTRAAAKMERANAKPDAEKRYTCPTCNNKFDDDPDEPEPAENERRCHRCGNLLDDAARMAEWQAEAAPDFEKSLDAWQQEQRSQEEARVRASHAAAAAAQADAEASHADSGVDTYLASLDGEIERSGEQLGAEFVQRDALDEACAFLSQRPTSVVW